ncbi:MAG: FAD-binding oxidoreductase, partial [Planctomycetota bacterium]
MPTPPPLRPQDGAEIPGILRSAGDAGVMLVPRGRGTRPLVATRGARILEIAGIRGIDDLDAGEMVVTMLAGTLCEEVDRAARRHGLFLPPLFPGALQGTIGGLYSDPRESPLWPAIGRTRDSVLGIEGVRGDGTPFKAGGRVVKNVTGYDLTRLLCGARGRLGVVTRLHWRLFPRPGRIATARVRFEDEDALWEGLDGVRRQAGEPLLIALEEIDPPTVLVAEAGRGGVEVALLGRRLGALGGGERGGGESRRSGGDR